MNASVLETVVVSVLLGGATFYFYTKISASMKRMTSKTAKPGCGGCSGCGPAQTITESPQKVTPQTQPRQTQASAPTRSCSEKSQ